MIETPIELLQRQLSECQRDLAAVTKENATLREDLTALYDIIYNTPELSMSNYSHDDVAKLNSDVCQAYAVVRKYEPPKEASDE